MLVEHAENDHLELLAEGGLVAATLVVALVALVLTQGLRGAAGASQRLASGLVTGAMAGLVAIGAHSAFDFNLRIPSNAALAALCAAAVAAAAGTRARPLSRPLALRLAAAALVLAAATARLPQRPGLLARRSSRQRPRPA